MASADDALHPLAWPDTALWNRQARSLRLTFLGLPLLLTACMWSAYLAPRRAPSGADLISVALSNVWAAQIILSLWLGLVAILRGAGAIAHLRETGIWPLVKIMPYDLSEIYRQKAAAVERGLRWPIRLVLGLRAASVILSYFVTPGAAPIDAALAVLFVYAFCAELLISVRYNCALGLLASTLARTTAQAQGYSHILQGVLFVTLFAPLWWSFLNRGALFALGSLPAGGTGEVTLPAILQYGLLGLVQLLVIGVCYSLAIRRAVDLVE